LLRRSAQLALVPLPAVINIKCLVGIRQIKVGDEGLVTETDFPRLATGERCFTADQHAFSVAGDSSTHVSGDKSQPQDTNKRYKHTSTLVFVVLNKSHLPQFAAENSRIPRTHFLKVNNHNELICRLGVWLVDKFASLCVRHCSAVGGWRGREGPFILKSRMMS
jgi:hypothetical protein